MTLTICNTEIGGDVLENDYIVKEDGYGCVCESTTCSFSHGLRDFQRPADGVGFTDLTPKPLYRFRYRHSDIAQIREVCRFAQSSKLALGHHPK